jgi:hypothetical protein
MIVRLKRWAATIAISALTVGVAVAQNPPRPGPTAPPPVPKPGEALVTKPTSDECKRGRPYGLESVKNVFETPLCSAQDW